MFLRATPTPHVAGIISIHGRREFGIEAKTTPRLDLHFDDVEAAIEGDPVSQHRTTLRRRWAETNGLVEQPPALADAAAIIAFAESMRGAEGIVLCHCGGGISRSPAAALICLAVWRGEGTETDCATMIRGLRRGASPHRSLVRFADQLLGRGGRLVAAADSGADARQ